MNAIAGSLWSLDIEGINANINGILKLRDVQYVSVKEGGELIAETGEKKSENILSQTFIITLKGQGLGYLEVQMTLVNTYHRVIQQTLTILLGNILKTTLVVTIMFIIFYHLVFVHIIKIIEHITSLESNLKRVPLKLSRDNKNHPDDELSLLTLAINRMQVELNISLDKLNYSETRFKDFAEISSDWFWETDPEGRITWETLSRQNRTSSLNGLTHEETAKTGDLNINWEAFKQQFKAHKKIIKFEYNYIGDKGEIIVAELDGKPLFDDSEAFIGYRGTTSDITLRKKHELQLRHASKMKAIGQLAGGIAHDFNNILAIVLGNLEILEGLSTTNKKAISRIKTAQRGCARGVDIVQKLLTFSRKTHISKKAISINSVIEDIYELIKDSLSTNITINKNLYPELWVVNVNRGDLEDALLNIIINARDAMPHGGNLQIETKNNKICPAFNKHHVSGNIHGEFVEISIRDTGVGMNLKSQTNALEPFFTTKKKGTGLGLSMVYEFVNRSGGFIKLTSEEGKGTTFSFSLPRYRNQNDNCIEDTNICGNNIIPTGSETILVVDDEEDIREVIYTWLLELGYKVITAQNGSQALNILNKTKNISLLFSDISMPGKVNGLKLASIAHKKYPSLKVLLTSGDTDKLTKKPNNYDNYTKKLLENILAKPYEKQKFAIHIRKTLDK